ncbi:MAG TPA: VOC family protein [Burkholderiales bacterium]|nr:VOC family protein [Burkholderiales bacterium]
MEKQRYKLRHIALSVPDVAQAQKFFEEAFGMTKAGDAQRGVYMTDGTINVALLARGGKAPEVNAPEPFYGVLHFGMWVDDLAQAEEQVRQAGAVHFQGRPPNTPNSYYEVKYRDPTGMVFDITASGWRGAVKNVKPAD